MSDLVRRTSTERSPRRRELFRRRPLLESLEGRTLLTAGVTEFPTPILNPTDLVVGGDGNFWALGTDDSGNSVLTVVVPDGTVKASYPIPTPGAGAASPTLGPDGNLWFVESSVDKIGKVTPDGVFTEYAIPNATGGNAPVDLNNPTGPAGVAAWPTSIVAGADGALWFTESSSDAIGRITTDGAITQTPTPGLQPNTITLGPDHKIWFTDNSYYNTIDRLNPPGSLNADGSLNAAGSVSSFPLPTDFAFPTGLTTGPDGALWFAENGTNAIGRITTDGAVTEAPIRGNLTSPEHLTFDLAHNLWVTGYGGGLARITPQGLTTIVGQQPGAGGSTSGITTAPDGSIWFTDTTSNQVGRVDLTSVSTLASDHPLIAGPEWANGANTSGALTYSDRLGSFYDGNPSGLASDFTAQIHWGDGSTSDGTVASIGPGQFSVTGTHDFASYGTYTATVTIADVNPAHTPQPNVLTLTTSIAVSDQPILPPSVPILGGVTFGTSGGAAAGSAGGAFNQRTGGSIPTAVKKHVTTPVNQVPSALTLFRAGYIKTWFMASHQQTIQHHAVVVPAKHHAAIVIPKHQYHAVVPVKKLLKHGHKAH